MSSYCERDYCAGCCKGPLYLWAKGLCARCHWDRYGPPPSVKPGRRRRHANYKPADHLAALAERVAKGEPLFTEDQT